jgi:hypothetical protein
MKKWVTVTQLLLVLAFVVWVWVEVIARLP